MTWAPASASARAMAAPRWPRAARNKGGPAVQTEKILRHWLLRSPAPQRCQSHGKQVFTLPCGGCTELAAAQQISDRIALLETALRHSKVANTLTIGHPAGASSRPPSDGPHYKGTTFHDQQTSSRRRLTAASSARRCRHGAMAADAAQGPQAHRRRGQESLADAQKPRTTRRTIPPRWPPSRRPRPSPAARPMTI